MAGNRTRVNCLEGSYAYHYTTIAVLLLFTLKLRLSEFAGLQEEGRKNATGEEEKRRSMHQKGKGRRRNLSCVTVHDSTEDRLHFLQTQELGTVDQDEDLRSKEHNMSEQGNVKDSFSLPVQKSVQD